MQARSAASYDGMVTQVIVDILKSDLETVTSESHFRNFVRRVVDALEQKAIEVFWVELEPKIRDYMRETLTPEFVSQMVGNMVREKFLDSLYKPGVK